MATLESGMTNFSFLDFSTTARRSPLEEILPGGLDIAAVSLPRLLQNTDMTGADASVILLACKPSPILFISTNDEAHRLRLEDRLSGHREYSDAVDALGFIAPSPEICPTNTC